jgi:hypothetical protein
MGLQLREVQYDVATESGVGYAILVNPTAMMSPGRIVVVVGDFKLSLIT